MSSFIADFDAAQCILNVKFGDPATNAQIVQDVVAHLSDFSERCAYKEKQSVSTAIQG